MFATRAVDNDPASAKGLDVHNDAAVRDALHGSIQGCEYRCIRRARLGLALSMAHLTSI
jgi:hypothetical protein